MMKLPENAQKFFSIWAWVTYPPHKVVGSDVTKQVSNQPNVVSQGQCKYYYFKLVFDFYPLAKKTMEGRSSCLSFLTSMFIFTVIHFLTPSNGMVSGNDVYVSIKMKHILTLHSDERNNNGVGNRSNPP